MSMHVLHPPYHTSELPRCTRPLGAQAGLPGLTEVTGVVRMGSATDAARFVFPSNAGKERMQPSCLSRVKDRHGTRPRRNHRSIGKTDPLASILVKEVVANSPVGRFVFTSVRVDLPGDLGGQLIGNALQRTPRFSSDNSTGEQPHFPLSLP